MAWDAGEKRRLTATFSPAALSRDPAKPVTITIKGPDGTVLVNEVNANEESPTEFYYDFTAPDAGLYWYKFKSEDGVIEQDKFNVIPSYTK